MSEERFLVTGALGCVGAWIARNLVREGVPITIYDLGTNRHRLELVMSDEEIERIQFIRDDITVTDAVVNAVVDNGITNIIHLAALQVPFCKANPVTGARVNVVGTVNVFEAAKAAGIKQIAYASSIAVYGPPDHYAERILPHDALAFPLTLYGVYKQANEATARVYWQDNGIASIALRAYTIYGPARDQGMTSEPTKAMLAAAKGLPYHIPFGGICGFQHVDDVAKTFIKVARTPFQGAEVFNLRGEIVPMGDVVSAIEAAAPEVAGQITYNDVALPFPEGFDDAELVALLGDVPNTPIGEGVANTIEHFQQAINQGRLKEDQ